MDETNKQSWLNKLNSFKSSSELISRYSNNISDIDKALSDKNDSVCYHILTTVWYRVPETPSLLDSEEWKTLNELRSEYIQLFMEPSWKKSRTKHATG